MQGKFGHLPSQGLPMNIAGIGVLNLEWRVTGAGCTEVMVRFLWGELARLWPHSFLHCYLWIFLSWNFLCNLIDMISFWQMQLFKAQCTVTMILESGDLFQYMWWGRAFMLHTTARNHVSVHHQTSPWTSACAVHRSGAIHGVKLYSAEI